MDSAKRLAVWKTKSAKASMRGSFFSVSAFWRALFDALADALLRLGLPHAIGQRPVGFEPPGCARVGQRLELGGGFAWGVAGRLAFDDDIERCGFAAMRVDPRPHRDQVV